MVERLAAVFFLLFLASGLVAWIAWALAVMRLRRNHFAYWESLGRPGIFVAPGFFRSAAHAMAEQGRAEYDFARDHRTLGDRTLDRFMTWRRGAGRVAAPALVATLVLIGALIASNPPK